MDEYGTLQPCGGGDPIPLVKKRLVVGRRESCDIVLRFGNVSGQHCKMSLEEGYWFVKDLNSRNGTKVNGSRVMRKRLDPGTRVSIAKHEFTIDYDPQKMGAYGPPPPDDDHMEELLRSSLMDRAGLARRNPNEPRSNRDPLED